MKFNFELTSNDGDSFRTLRLIDVAAEIARLSAEAPGLVENLCALRDHKGHLTVETRNEPSALLQLIVRDVWKRVGQEDCTEVTFETETPPQLEPAF